VKARAVVTECGAVAGVRVAILGSDLGRFVGSLASGGQVSLASEAISMADCSHGQAGLTAAGASGAVRGVISVQGVQLVGCRELGR
jgi:hypothetical protein